MPDNAAPASLLSHFWAPLTAVGSHGPNGPNAQICVSVFGASIVPERPRLLVNLSNTNYTTGLVAGSGTLAITLLADGQESLLGPLGLHSGRDGNKLNGIQVELDRAGDPWFPGGVGVLECRVIDTYDLGDSTSFLCGIREQCSLGGDSPLLWTRAREVVGAEFLRRWAQKSEQERARAFAAMRW
jgi:flavin reductase (DIM6/NTAB) family NADH-FMN oxidoreductase RutF